MVLDSIWRTRLAGYPVHLADLVQRLGQAVGQPEPQRHYADLTARIAEIPS